MVIDLSLPIEEGMAGFPGYPGYEVSRLQDYDTDGKQSHHVSMNTHQGTHVDAPAHFIEGGATVDELPLDKLCGPARVIDLRAHSGETITAGTLRSAAPELSAERVLLLSGDVDAHFRSPDFFEEAAVLSLTAAEWLLDHGVEVLANDFLTESLHVENRPVHRALLGEGVPIVEYLCNIDDIVTEESVEFRCLPLALSGLEAAPVRAAVF